MSAPDRDITALYETHEAETREAETREAETTGPAGITSTQETAVKQVRGRPFRKEDGRFVKGSSGNPGGRKRGLVREIERLCGGASLPKPARALALIAWGRPDERRAFFGETVRVGTALRLEAIQQLLDRGVGKPRMFVEAQVQEKPVPVEDAREKLLKMLDGLARAEALRTQLLTPPPRVVIDAVPVDDEAPRG